MMNRIKSWWSTHKPTKRRLIQLYAALLFNANLKGFFSGRIYQGPLKNICTPGLNCYSCPGAVGACPMGALQNALSSSNHTVPFYVFGIILLYGLLFGRWICGFLCPFGLIQDLLHKIHTPKIGKSRLTRLLSYFKYVILAFFVIFIPLAYVGFPMPGFCKYICPAGTLEGAIGLLSNPANENQMGMLGGLFTWKFLLMVIFLVGAIFLYRFFCRFFCPLGAIYGLFNKISLVGIKLDRDACTDCGLCIGKCKMDIREVGDHECINCGECIEVCPTNAIQWKGPKILLPKQAIGGEIPVKVKATATASPAPAAEPVIAAAAPDAEVLTAAVPAAEPVEAEGMSVEATAEATETAESVEPVATEPAELAESGVESVSDESAENVAEDDATDMAAEKKDKTAEKPKKKAKTEKVEQADKPAASTAKPVGAQKSFDFRYWLDRIVYGRDFADCKGVKTDEMMARAQTHKRDFIIRTSTLGVLFALLLTILLIANLGDRQDPAVLPETSDSGAAGGSDGETDAAPLPPVGNQVGNLCPGMDLQLYGDAGTVNVHDLRGKVTVINFWGIWCGPCVTELPHFDAVAQEYGDRVTVLTVHSEYESEDPVAWIAKNYPNSTMLFAKDGVKDAFYTALGGVATYPMTVILDADGVITFTRPGNLNHEDLVSAVEEALQN